MGSSTTGPTGIAIIDKPAGWTSHDVVARARGVLDTRKVGHSGTLDPGATGVLILGVGRATRLLRFLTALSKSYECEVVFGVETNTLDDSGEVTARHDMAGIDMARISEVAAGFVGEIRQVPPMVSAVKVGGRRLHELAREGLEVEREARTVTVHDLTVEATDAADVVRMTVDCSSGTYVRTLAADLGTALGGGAHLRALRRTKIGSFGLDEATSIEEATVLPAAVGLRDYPSVTVDGDRATDIGHGKVLERVDLGVDGQGPWAVLGEAGGLLAVYEAHKGTTVKPAVVLS